MRKRAVAVLAAVARQRVRTSATARPTPTPGARRRLPRLMGFSRQGLIEQLEFEGHSTED